MGLNESFTLQCSDRLVCGGLWGNPPAPLSALFLHFCEKRVKEQQKVGCSRLLAPPAEREMMLLTPEEVADLTGYRKHSAQIRWLDAQQIPYLVGGDGRAKVLRAPLVERLGGSVAQPCTRQEPQLRLDSVKPKRNS